VFCEKLDGVIDVVSGYSGGKKKNPTYKEVSSGQTLYTESVQITYDPSKVSYEKLLDVFWMSMDPTTKDRSFNDVGPQYRSAIFYHNDEQKVLAEKSKIEYDKKGIFGKPIVTEISPETTFYDAEEYHQDYYKKNPIRYKYYRFGSGRDAYLKKIWGDKK